ncbi:MAG: alkaline phosphatase family protein [Nitrospinota bacterium]|nr:alkaline phosphatase family protein [Nitrospinota bacterium]
MGSVILGLDGVPFGLIKKYSSEGILPNINSVLENGTFVRMESSIPDVSSTAWSSVITGKNPGEHGIFGFIEVNPANYEFRFPNFNDLKTSPFWTGRKAAIINVPQTFPAKIENGLLVSGFVALDLERSVYPASLIPKLRSMDYRVDVDSNLAHESIDIFMDDLFATLEARNRFFKYAWELEDWDIFYFVFTETDRLNHFLFDAWDDASHKYHGVFTEFYRRIDDSIGRILEKIAGSQPVYIHSDHGFCPLKTEFYINRWLQENGFLEFNSTDPKTIMEINPDSKAFALDPGRIYINSKDRFPSGGVNPSDVEKIKTDIREGLLKLETESMSPIMRILDGNDIFRGPESSRAPDLVAIGERGYDIKSLVAVDGLYGKRHFRGMHTQDDAFIISSTRDDRITEPFHVEKIADLIL